MILGRYSNEIPEGLQLFMDRIYHIYCLSIFDSIILVGIFIVLICIAFIILNYIRKENEPE